MFNIVQQQGARCLLLNTTRHSVQCTSMCPSHDSCVTQDCLKRQEVKSAQLTRVVRRMTAQHHRCKGGLLEVSEARCFDFQVHFIRVGILRFIDLADVIPSKRVNLWCFSVAALATGSNFCDLLVPGRHAGHSLWLIPKEPGRSKIQNVIDHYSSEQGTVKFGAHVTLIAGLEPEGGVEEVLKKTEGLGEKIQPFSARVERTACMDLYFKSVFAVLERDALVLDAHNAAREAFGQDLTDGHDFMPHASLVYGDPTKSTRENIREEAQAGPVNPGTELEFDRIEVWCTQGVVADWKLVGTVFLSPPKG
ncbi:unnamed protein product [Scytosiphon promiscuus]